MRFLSDQRLYASVDACLDHLRVSGTNVPDEPWIGHLYWRGRFGRKQAFAVKSFLATQPRDRSSLWLWLDADRGYPQHERNPSLVPLLPFLTVKPFDARVEAAGTPLEDRLSLYHGLNDVHRSNLVRFVVLHNYGGVYADMDTMFLRDLGGLLADPKVGEAFCYRWSAHVPRANSALVALGRGSPVSRQILERCRERASCRPRDVLRFDEDGDLNLLVLPCAYFDPLWPIHDGKDTSAAAPFGRFSDFFRCFDRDLVRRADISAPGAFFPGAFAYHWHNCWHDAEHDDSYFGLFERVFDDRLGALFGMSIERA